MSSHDRLISQIYHDRLQAIHLWPNTVGKINVGNVRFRKPWIGWGTLRFFMSQRFNFTVQVSNLSCDKALVLVTTYSTLLEKPQRLVKILSFITKTQLVPASRQKYQCFVAAAGSCPEISLNKHPMVSGLQVSKQGVESLCSLLAWNWNDNISWI